jgi:hypothetical protein
MLQQLVTSGRVVDVIIVVMIAEAVVLFLYHRRTSLGPPPAEIVAMLVAGLCLLLALRAALTGSNWLWIAAFLTTALVAHLVDLHRRWWA